MLLCLASKNRPHRTAGAPRVEGYGFLGVGKNFIFNFDPIVFDGEVRRDRGKKKMHENAEKGKKMFVCLFVPKVTYLLAFQNASDIYEKQKQRFSQEFTVVVFINLVVAPLVFWFSSKIFLKTRKKKQHARNIGVCRASQAGR